MCLIVAQNKSHTEQIPQTREHHDDDYIDSNESEGHRERRKTNCKKEEDSLTFSDKE
jgi:hypothetical protein